jgi:hypothetical protein
VRKVRYSVIGVTPNLETARAEFVHHAESSGSAQGGSAIKHFFFVTDAAAK